MYHIFKALPTVRAGFLRPPEAPKHAGVRQIEAPRGKPRGIFKCKENNPFLISLATPSASRGEGARWAFSQKKVMLALAGIFRYCLGTES